MRILPTIALSALLLTAPSVYAEPSIEDLHALVYERAEAHNTDPAPIIRVIDRESRFNPSARGRLREVGLSQWLPGRGNAWDYTTAYREQHIDIHREYASNNPDAPYFDIDGIAELFSKGRAMQCQHWSSTLDYC